MFLDTFFSHMYVCTDITDIICVYMCACVFIVGHDVKILFTVGRSLKKGLKSTNIV